MCVSVSRRVERTRELALISFVDVCFNSTKCENWNKSDSNTKRTKHHHLTRRLVVINGAVGCWRLIFVCDFDALQIVINSIQPSVCCVCVLCLLGTRATAIFSFCMQWKRSVAFLNLEFTAFNSNWFSREFCRCWFHRLCWWRLMCSFPGRIN